MAIRNLSSYHNNPNKWDCIWKSHRKRMILQTYGLQSLKQCASTQTTPQRLWVTQVRQQNLRKTYKNIRIHTVKLLRIDVIDGSDWWRQFMTMMAWFGRVVALKRHCTPRHVSTHALRHACQQCKPATKAPSMHATQWTCHMADAPAASDCSV